MGFEEEGDDDQPAAGPLHPDDRLWRHPSELSGGAAVPLAWPERPHQPRRTLVLAALASACLTGAVTALALTWLASPAEQASDTAAPTGPGATAAFGRPTAWSNHLRVHAPSVAHVTARTGSTSSVGTGVWVDADGTLIVAEAIVRDATAIEVTDHTGRRGRGELLGVDQATAIAIVRVPGAQATPLQAAAAAPSSGDPVAVVTVPATTAAVASPQLLRSTVGAVDRRATLGREVVHGAILLERALPPQLAGALVIDAAGAAVAIVVDPVHHDGPALAIPADHARDAALDIRDLGQVRRPWLGVRAADAPASGAVLTRVSAGSPAAGAGLRVGDVVVQVDDQPVADASDLVMALRACRPGQRVAVRVERDGESEPIPVPVQLAG